MYHYQMAAPLWTIVKEKIVAAWNGRDPNDVVWWKRSWEESLIGVVQYNSDEGRLQFASST
jgi:hypothetical protein